MKSDRPLRIGLLGAARITSTAIVAPARELGVELVAVAARDRARAEGFAAQHGVRSVYDDYQDVLDDPAVEVVYNPLANSLHAPWNLRAVAAGKHVLTEKPFSSNAAEARVVRDAAQIAGVHVVEAFHQLYHPITERLHAIVRNEEIGQLQYVEARMLMPAPAPADPRWRADLSGGSLMDVGCYALRALRDIASLLDGGEPNVISATGGGRTTAPGVDAWLAADLELPGGIPAHIESSMTHHCFDSTLRLVGSDGEALAPDFIKPNHDDRIIISTGGEQRIEHLGQRSTYSTMLEALTRLIRDDVPMRTDAADAVRSMQLVDDVYRAAGMTPRNGTTTT